MAVQSAHKALILASINPAADWSPVEHQRRLLTSHTLGLCEAVAGLWCRSFGAARQAPVRRLTESIAAGLANFPVTEADRVDLVDRLHSLARAAIEGWFRASEMDVSGRNFDRLRYRYLMICRDSAWPERFLDRDVVGERLRTALTGARFAATPPRYVQKMARQSL